MVRPNRDGARTGLLPDTWKKFSEPLRGSYSRNLSVTRRATARGKRETVSKDEGGLRVLVAVRQHLRLVLRTQFHRWLRMRIKTIP